MLLYAVIHMEAGITEEEDEMLCFFQFIILWVSNEHSDWSTDKRYLFARAVQYGGLKNFRPGFVHKIVNISLVWGRSTQSECSLETQRIIKA